MDEKRGDKHIPNFRNNGKFVGGIFWTTLSRRLGGKSLDE